MAVNGYAAAQDVAELKTATAALAVAMGARVASNEENIATNASNVLAANETADVANNAAQAAVAGLATSMSALAGAGGAAMLGILQSGVGAAFETVQTVLRRIIVSPEQFTGTDTEKVQGALNSAGDLPGSQAIARVVRLSRIYDTTATVNVPPYVSIEGVGSGRSGIRPTMSSGPAVRASIVNSSSAYLTEWRDFGITGVNATGSAFALDMTGQKITTLSRLRFSLFDTSEHAVQFDWGCQSIILDQCQFYKNRLNERIGIPYVGTSFPTTITHKTCIYEDSPTVSLGTEAILLADANGCSWINRCVFQSLNVPTVFRVTSSANEQTSANHLWESVYLEANGVSHQGANTWRFEGNAARPIRGCTIVNSDIHGASPGGGHIYAINTILLSADTRQNPAHTWFVDGGGNVQYNEQQVATLIATTAVQSNGTYKISTRVVMDADANFLRFWPVTGAATPFLYAGSDTTFTRCAEVDFKSADFTASFAKINTTGLRLSATRAVFVNDLQVVGARGAAVPDVTASTAAGVNAVAAPTMAEFNALVTQVNAVVTKLNEEIASHNTTKARLRAATGHGLFT